MPQPRHTKGHITDNNRLFLNAKHTQFYQAIKMHRNCACHYSRVIEDKVKESDCHFYRLEEPELIIVKILVDWFYNQNFNLADYDLDKLTPVWISCPKPKTDAELATRTKSLAHARTCLALAKLWIVGEQLHIRSLQNLCIDKLEDIQKKTTFVPTAIFQYVWANTSKNSRLRNFLVQECAKLDPKIYAMRQERFPKEMLVDIMQFTALTSDQRAQLYKNRHPGYYRYS